FLKMSVNDRRNDERDAYFVVDDLPDEEVLFAETALFMGPDEFRRRVALLAANGSNDLVQSSWKKDEGIENYAID
uniref:hypothetical protein n=1 Tax=Acinetobacter baumannii TaxID=470 RepID=UPI0013D852DA